MGKINKAYPLRGSILKQKGNRATLDIGEEVGIREGQRFRIVDSDVVLEIVSTQKGQSEAKIVTGDKLVETGQRVEQAG